MTRSEVKKRLNDMSENEKLRYDALSPEEQAQELKRREDAVDAAEARFATSRGNRCAGFRTWMKESEKFAK